MIGFVYCCYSQFLLQIFTCKQKLEGLYRKVPIQRKSQNPLKMPVKMLIQILREQEVGQTREHKVNGLVFRVHVLKIRTFDVEKFVFTEMEEAKMKYVIWNEAVYIEINSF